MKIAFCTCVKIGLTCIEAIYEINGKIDLLITLKDNQSTKKSGRIYLDKFSDEFDIPLLKISHVNDEECIKTIKDYNIDWLFIIGWSQIASEMVLNSVKLGVIGAHPTLLPIGRGRAAIPWAIIKGLDKTGVTIFKMDNGVDTGLILGQKEITLEKGETATTLYKKVNKAHEFIIKQVYKNIKNDNVAGKIQDETKATYWPGRKPQDGEFYLENSVSEVDILVRATTKPYPGAFIFIDDKKYIVWSGKPGVHKGFCIYLNDGAFTFTNYEIT